jgi:hypothetical protein
MQSGKVVTACSRALTGEIDSDDGMRAVGRSVSRHKENQADELEAEKEKKRTIALR